MTGSSNIRKPITTAFIGALQKNEEMNKGVKSKKVEAKAEPTDTSKNPAFITDAFLESLKINEEMNKKYGVSKIDKEGGK